MENKEQVKEQIQKKGNMWGGKGWIGNIVKNLEPVKTPEEHWLEVRSKIKSEYIPLFDKNSNPVFRHILLDYSKSKMKEIVLSLYHFKDLTEKDFMDLKTISKTLLIRSCKPGDLLLALFHKKEIEGYKLKLVLSDQTKKDLYSDDWSIDYYKIFIT